MGSLRKIIPTFPLPFPEISVCLCVMLPGIPKHRPSDPAVRPFSREAAPQGALVLAAGSGGRRRIS